MLRNILRIAAAGFGATLIVSAAVNIAATLQLVDRATEESIGVSRSEWIVTYSVIAAIGAMFVWLGLRRWKK
jgi:hypothetical protein